MNATLLSAAAVAAAYLIGAVPFGYMLAKKVRGIDIRTVGSGNIGATNVGRVLGLRYFWIVFAFDLAKGLLPTLGFPPAVAALTGQAPADLPVLVALASILGHNYPVYLKFKGGKGVATSLGAVLALDPVASLAAAAGFLLSLAVNRYVSLSSLVGGAAFAAVYFARVDQPWARGHVALSLLTVGLLVLLVVRHRKNLARIAAGTEPKVGRGKKADGGAPVGEASQGPRPTGPPGRVAAGWLVVVAAAGLAAFVGATWVMRTVTPRPLPLGSSTLREVARAGTGQQRAERVVFADRGRLLAVTCPRYQRVALFRVGEASLEPFKELDLGGRPVAVAASADRLYVLLRPPGDRRHVEPGWWQAFDFQGQPQGGRVPAGYYPDDLAVSPDGRLAYVVCSGRGEGDADKPAPDLAVFDTGSSRALGRVSLDGKGDDPSRLSLSDSGQAAAVTIPGAKAVVSFDLTDPSNPRALGRQPLAEAAYPYPSRTSGDRILMPVVAGNEAAVVPVAGVGDCVACTLPRGSGLEVFQAATRRSLGRLTLRSGALGLSATRPVGLAYAPERGLIAVTNRSGGVHLVALRATTAPVAVGDAGLGSLPR